MAAVLYVSIVVSAGCGDDEDDDGSGAPNAQIQHVVLVMMENRSFDHFLGWLPNADGRQAGPTYADTTGAVHTTTPLAPDCMGCAHPDPDHSFEGARVQYNGGAMDSGRTPRS